MLSSWQEVPQGLRLPSQRGENGLKSIILEKSSTTGGAANMGMGPLGIDTKIQKANFNNISVQEALDMHMQYTHYRVDEDLVQTYFNKSADTIEWLQEMGVEFAGAFRYFKESEATWHIVKPRERCDRTPCGRSDDPEDDRARERTWNRDPS